MSDSRQVFGLHAVGELLGRNPSAVRELLLSRGRTDRRLNALREMAARAGIPCRSLDRRELDALASGTHQGVVAVIGAAASAPVLNERGLLELLAARGAEALLLVLDSVTDPHNLGACLRCADAAGADAVVIPAHKSAPVNAAARKVASGAAETVPVATVANLARFLDRLKQAGVWVAGAAGDVPSAIFDQDLTGPIAFVLGSEGKGIRRLVREKCDFLVAIPMRGSLRSLNVSVAAGICLFEVVRQRRGQLRGEQVPRGNRAAE